MIFSLSPSLYSPTQISFKLLAEVQCFLEFQNQCFEQKFEIRVISLHGLLLIVLKKNDKTRDFIQIPCISLPLSESLSLSVQFMKGANE